VARQLHSDQRGAILVVGAFASAFLIGLLYFVFGVGIGLEHHATMQDAADALALALGAAYAGAMNVMATLNMIKVSLLALWLAAEGQAYYGIGQGPPPSLQRTIEEIDRAQQETRDQTAQIAEGKALDVALPDFEPLVTGAMLWPQTPLPVELGTVAEMCEKAVPMAMRVLDAQSPGIVPRSDVQDLCQQANVRAYRLERGADLGAEPLQRRAVVLGDALPGLPESGVRMATWRRNEPGGTATDVRDQLGRIAFAQVETYVPSDEPRQELLWAPAWESRLRRFSVDENGAAELEGACNQSLGDARACGALADFLTVAPEAVVH
jgi:hypothetical protein